ncbi:MAG: hypothetical protein WAO23_01455 [Dethiobacteria bacterium]
MTGRKMVRASTICCTGYKVLMSGSDSPDSRGWYRLEKSLGLYRGAIDPLTGTPHDIKGELRLEYGNPHNRKTVTYVGSILYGLMQGEGRIIWPCGTLYKGSFKNGCRHGSGVLVLPYGREIRQDYYYGSEVCSVE